MLAAIMYVLTTGCAWRDLPFVFDVSKATVRCRFVAWTQVGLWRRVHVVTLDQLGAQGLIDGARAIADAASVRAKKRGAT